MDLFTRFNRKTIDDRQIDTLIGLAKGISGDGVISQSEAEFLFSWLIQARQATTNPIVVNLLTRVGAYLEDGILDDSEAAELLTLIRELSGEASVIGELARTSSLPIDVPPPNVEFQGRSFGFTGTCAYGTRRECQRATETLGGISANTVSKDLNYLVLGTYVTDSWAHEAFGRKIEKAMALRNSGAQIRIITEEHWASAGQLIPN